MSINIAVDGDIYNQYFPLILEGKEYIFKIHFNDTLVRRDFINNSGWYISIYDAELYDESLDTNLPALLVASKKIMPNVDLFGRTYTDTFLKGMLMCLDTETEKGLSEDYAVGKDTFGIGKRFQLFYFTEEEKLELGL